MAVTAKLLLLSWVRDTRGWLRRMVTARFKRSCISSRCLWNPNGHALVLDDSGFLRLFCYPLSCLCNTLVCSSWDEWWPVTRSWCPTWKPHYLCQVHHQFHSGIPFLPGDTAHHWLGHHVPQRWLSKCSRPPCHTNAPRPHARGFLSQVIVFVLSKNEYFECV